MDQGKKRPNDSAAKTPVSAKKAKAVTPQKTGEALDFAFFFYFFSLCIYFLGTDHDHYYFFYSHKGL